MTIKYWTDFSKRKNSTKQPTGGTQATVVLKEPCGIASPSFICNSVPDTVKYIEAFGRYYFVSEVTHDGGEIVVDCVSDPMATFKSSIGSLYANVEYTSSSTNTDIADPRNRPTNLILKKNSDLGNVNTLMSGVSCYVVGVANDDGANYYMMDDTQLKNLVSKMFDNNFFVQIENNFFDAKNVLISCCVLPRLPLEGHTPIKVGTLTLGEGYLIPPTDRVVTLYENTKAVSFPADDYGYDFSYLDCSPYCSGTLFLPFVGVVDLDVDTIATNKSIYIKCSLDQLTGDLVYLIGIDSSNIIKTYSGNCAANIPICGSSYNAIGAAGGALGVVGGIAGLVASIASEGGAIPIVAAAGGLIGSATATVSSLQHHTQVNGSLSTFVGVSMGTNIKTCVMMRKPTDTAIDSAFKAVSGMPYFKGATISTLSGYVKCNGASISISGFESDRETINEYLNSGFYYE